MTAIELQKEGLKIIENWNNGGNYAHNVVAAALRAMSEHDKDYANKIHKELMDEHGY